jgi:uncharacterized protein YjbI with pentapeptide repeats
MGLETSLPPEGRPKSDAGERAPAESRAPSSPPELLAPAASDLPPIAAKADDLEAIKKAVDDTASVSGGLWLSYLFVLFYLAIAAGAVTHADLFLENPVKLPFLNIELPLLAFFFLAPILFLVVHAYTLVHLVMLTDKAKRFHQELRRQIPEDDNLPKEELDKRNRIRTGLRQQLPSNVFVQYLAGSPETRGGAFGWLLWLIAAITLANAPVLLLLLLQVQFLPYHNSFITWTHRIVLLTDIILVWWLWQRILYGRLIEGRGPRLAWWTGWALGLASSIIIIFFSLAVATFPGEWREDHLSEWAFAQGNEAFKQGSAEHARPKETSLEGWVEPVVSWGKSTWNSALNEGPSVHDVIFNSPVDQTTRRRWLPFSSTLVLTGFNVVEGLGVDDPKKLDWRDFIFRARGRDLKGARFDFATLPKVDFEYAELEDASLDSAQLRGASFYRTQLQGASLNNAYLQGTSLDDAELQGAKLNGAQLQGASLNHAELQNAVLNGAQLQGASLDRSRLEGASLTDGGLQGVSLKDAELQGAWLNGTQLQGASLDRAQLQGAWLNDSQLQGASLDSVLLQGASLNRAQLQGTSLDSAQLQGATLKDAQLQGASLAGADLEVVDLSYAYLWRTDRTQTPSVGAIRMSDVSWRPKGLAEHGEEYAWDEQAYLRLRAKIETLPQGKLRDQAIERIRSLDCSNPDPTLVSCDPSAAPPPEAAAWRKALEKVSVNEKAYATALAEVLRSICGDGDEGIARSIVRGAGFQNRLKARPCGRI